MTFIKKKKLTRQPPMASAEFRGRERSSECFQVVPIPPAGVELWEDRGLYFVNRILFIYFFWPHHVSCGILVS